jgi:hypothetical protein
MHYKIAKYCQALQSVKEKKYSRKNITPKQARMIKIKKQVIGGFLNSTTTDTQ